jgi:hypothetical protein
MSLPDSFRRYGTSVFAQNPEIVHEWSIEPDRCYLVIPALSPDGFEIRLEIGLNAVTLYWGNWHTRFESTARLVEELFGLLRDMLSSDMRIRELCANSSPYRGILETYDGTRWSTEHEMGLIFWNYFGKRPSGRTPTQYCLDECLRQTSVLCPIDTMGTTM